MMDSERALVPGSSGGLPAHIERRTRIANRVLGELERRDTEAFFRRHPEFFRLVVSRYYPLSEELIGRYTDFLDWKQLSENETILWNQVLIESFSKYWNWGEDNSYHWHGLSGSKVLPWGKTLINRFTNYWNWMLLSHNKTLPWSEALIDYYYDRWHWRELSGNTTLPWSEAFINRYFGSSSVLVERSAIRIIWMTLIFMRLLLE